MSQTEDLHKRLQELRETINTLSYQYYTLDKPTMSDYEYDMMYRELENIEKEHPEWITPDSPTQRVGSKISGGFAKYTHDRPMLSMGDVFNDQELREFDQRVRDDLDGEDLEYVVELKIDGLAVNLIYEQGQFIRGVTRGDGVTGEDVTNNVRTIRTIPLHLQGDDYPDFFEIRGEVLMPYASFDRLNREREENGEPLLANPRNAAAGTLKQQSSAVVAQHALPTGWRRPTLHDPLGVYAESPRMGIQRIGQDADLPQPGGDRRLHRLLGRRAQETAVRYGRRGHQGQ